MKNYFLASIILLFFGAELSSQEIIIDESIVENLTPEQITEAQNIIQDFGSQNFLQSSEDDDELKKNETLSRKKIDEVSIISKYKFGYNFIATTPTSIVASSDLPFPNDYRISIGDLLGIIVTGSQNLMVDLRVGLDGAILFPQVGSITVAGKSFEEVKVELENILSQTYIGVEVDVSLKDLSAKKITIVGTVNNPGTYLVNPFTTISNALSYSGGVSEIGSLRKIKLIRPNGDIFAFDLYDLLINGDRTNDITIQSGDVILVGPVSKMVEIKGMVKRPGLYEILPDEDMADLLDYSLGFVGGANITNIAVRVLDIENNRIDTIVKDNLDMSLTNVIDVEVLPYQNDTNSNIQVFGAVIEPGVYELNKFQTLEDLINGVDFVDVYPWLAVLEQFDEDNMIKSSVIFNLKDPKTYKDIILFPNSRVFFANIDNTSYPVDRLSKQKIDDYSLTLNHGKDTYKLPVYGNFKIRSFIDLLGIDMSDVDEIATYISPLDSIVIQDNFIDMEFEAKKYNTVSFRSKINDLISVNISGEIDYPGNYTLKSGSTLEDLYSLVGNFKKEAFLNGIVFTRESVRERQLKAIKKSKADLKEALLMNIQKGQGTGDVSIIQALSQEIEPENLGRIAGDFSPKSNSSINTILFDGDSVIIPKNPNVINVFGEVLNPIAFEYKKRTSIREAINMAGGYKEYAKKNAVYVIKSNGLIVKANRNIFAGNQAKLEPGDTIVVPRRIVTVNPGIEALLPLTQILSDFSLAAAAVESLTNNN